MKIFNYNIPTKNLFIGVLLIIILFLAKCSGDINDKYKAQQIISKNNIGVLTDSIKTYKSKNGTLISERGVLIADKKELKELNIGLYEKVEDLEKSIPNMKPQVVIDYQTIIKHDTVYLNTSLVSNNDSTYTITFTKDTTYSEGNSRELSGSISINLEADTSKFNNVVVGEVELSKDITHMNATLVLGNKDGQLKVWMESEYPGFEPSEIDAVTLDPKIHPELRKLDKKRFSVGPYIGLGLGENLSIKPSIGVGVQYNLIKF